jgi:uncharacterized protein (UPF0333 family)
VDERAQTSVEYLLILAGVIAFVIIVVLLWNSRVFTPSVNTIENKISIYRNLSNVS